MLMKQLVLIPLFCCILGWLLPGCAAVLRSSAPNPLTVRSKPDSALVYIDGIYRATTPAIISLAPQKQYAVAVYKPGYRNIYDTLQTFVGSGWLIADLVSAVPMLGIPLIVDGLSGQWYTLAEQDTERFFYLMPGTDSIPLTSGTGPAPSRFALLYEAGMALPAYQTPIIPQSYGLGLGYKAGSSMLLVIKAEFDAIGFYQQKVSNQGTPYTTDASAILVSGMAALRLQLFGTGFFVTAGVGATGVSLSSFPNASPGLLPVAGVGAGYIFPGDKLFLEVRRVLVPAGLQLPKQPESLYLHHTTIRFGLVQPL